MGKFMFKHKEKQIYAASIHERLTITANTKIGKKIKQKYLHDITLILKEFNKLQKSGKFIAKNSDIIDYKSRKKESTLKCC